MQRQVRRLTSSVVKGCSSNQGTLQVMVGVKAGDQEDRQRTAVGTGVFVVVVVVDVFVVAADDVVKA